MNMQALVMEPENDVFELVRGRVLLVEDDPDLAELVREYLTARGMEVEIESQGDLAVERVLQLRPDAVILDLMLPGEDGMSICRRLRPIFQGVILMLTARGGELDQVSGLELGADAYLAKPVRPRVLLAHLRALLRRTGHKTDPDRLEGAGVVIDRTTLEATYQGRRIEMTVGETDLLWLLVEHAGRVLSRQTILERLKQVDYDGIDRTIDMRISKLRQKLGDDPKTPRIIRTVRGVGYGFMLP